VPHTDAIFGSLAEAGSELEAIAGLRRGRLPMASFESAVATLMPVAIATFKQRHPVVEPALQLSQPDDALPRLTSGELELALSSGADGVNVPADDGIERVHLLDDPLYAVLARDHPVARKRNLRLAELAVEPWIEGTPSVCSRMLRRACERASFTSHESDDCGANQGFVAADVGVALIAELALTTVLHILQDVAGSYEPRRPDLALAR
jgi:DNA-binding transcriptional LysR family regulator